MMKMNTGIRPIFNHIKFNDLITNIFLMLRVKLEVPYYLHKVCTIICSTINMRLYYMYYTTFSQNFQHIYHFVYNISYVVLSFVHYFNKYSVYTVLLLNCRVISGRSL